MAGCGSSIDWNVKLLSNYGGFNLINIAKIFVWYYTLRPMCFSSFRELNFKITGGLIAGCAI